MKVRLTTTVTGGTNPLLSALDASLTTNYAANLTVLSGAVAKGASSAYTFTAADPGSNLGTTPSKTLKSDYGVVYTGGDNLIRVTINSVTMNDALTTSFTALPVSFNKLLQAGRSYTLQVNFKRFTGFFAASNIYWDGSKLTFDAIVNGNNRRYQGVFFKWGSLVGISPTNETVYLPSYNSGSSPSWSGTENISSFFGGYSSIPLENNASIPADQTVNWLAADAQNMPDKWNAHTGDICRYISENGYGPGGKWRMPSAQEFENQISPISWDPTPFTEWGASSTPSNLTNGKFVLPRYLTGNDGTILPASGYRNIYGMEQNAGAQFAGRYGYLWTGSPGPPTQRAYSLFYNNNYVPALYMYAMDSISALSVRCVFLE
jgi:hypothetical protein